MFIYKYINEIDVVQGCFYLVISFFRYLIESGWLARLKKYIDLDHSRGTESKIFIVSAHPGPIDNGPLFQENSETPGLIKDGLIDELEYVLVPDEAWMALVEEFGLTDGQPPIHRKVIIIFSFEKNIYNTSYSLLIWF